jgi:flavin-dependent dehydrogenase
MYDVIVVGARCAGSATAMLLARKGYKVLVVDKATFPSDTLSTHQIQVPGGAALQRWGLLDRLRATNPGIVTGAMFDTGAVVLKGTYPAMDGVNSVHSPRRIILDKMLVDAAVEAGAELREGCVIEELLTEEASVIGIRGRSKTGATITEQARLVVGADGKHSLVANQVNAPRYHEHAPLTCGYYSYWEGIPLEIGEIYSRESRAIGAWPTHDGLTIIFTAWPISEFHQVRSEIDENYLKAIELAPHLAERARAGRRVERIMGTADLPNFFRKPYGSGWALVGDAGLVKDPITGMGIGEAFRDAELLATAIDSGFAGQKPLEQALADYEQQRNEAALPMYEFTLDVARMTPPSIEQRVLFAAIQNNQEATNQLFGMLTGAVPISEFFSGKNLFRLIGIGGIAKIIAGKMRAPLSTGKPQVRLA